MLMSGPLAVELRRWVTPDSRSRLPNISIPNNGPLAGTNNTVIRHVAIGKISTAVLETGRD